MPKTSLLKPPLLLLSFVALCIAALSAPLTQSAPAASAPPELAALLAKTSELQISSERFSGVVTIIPKKLPPQLKALGGLTLKLSGEESSSPRAAAITSTLLGRTVSLRLVDGSLYLREAAIAKHDGGRPWVRLDSRSSSNLFSSNPSLGSGSGLGGAGASTDSRFKVETALLKASKDVRALGPSTLDGQQVNGFAGTVDPKQIEQSQLSAKLRAEVLKAHVKPAATFEVFIAPNGLPVRSDVVLALGRAKLKVTANVLAINFPVAAIPAPPASETITAAELEKLVKTQKGKKK
jgi:hypothetical protein